METKQTDVIIYSGSINYAGYDAISNVLRQKKSDNAVLVLATYGGDPHAGFRIARALQHAYGKFDALVPRVCKSAGTLIVIGAARLFMDHMSELGPLDVQLKKSDELTGRNSGLDILQAVNYLQHQSMVAFKTYLVELTRDAGLSTRIAAELASGVTSGLFQPIAAQIDPIRLAETQRATEIAFEYGNRLNEKAGNLRGTGLAQLVTGYPSHSFVIDRKEARTVFIKVLEPKSILAEVSEMLRPQMDQHLDSQAPNVQLVTIPLLDQENEHADSSDAQSGTGGPGGGIPPLGEHSQGTESAEPPASSEQPAEDVGPDVSAPGEPPSAA